MVHVVDGEKTGDQPSGLTSRCGRTRGKDRQACDVDSDKVKADSVRVTEASGLQESLRLPPRLTRKAVGWRVDSGGGVAGWH